MDEWGKLCLENSIQCQKTNYHHHNNIQPAETDRSADHSTERPVSCAKQYDGTIQKHSQPLFIINVNNKLTQWKCNYIQLMGKTRAHLALQRIKSANNFSLFFQNNMKTSKQNHTYINSNIYIAPALNTYLLFQNAFLSLEFKLFHLNSNHNSSMRSHKPILWCTKME